MQIVESRGDGILVVALGGRIDSTTCDLLREHLLGLVARGERRLVVDFAAVDYISSAGLRVMLSLERQLRDHRGTLVLTALGAPVRHVFELSGLRPLFTIAPSRDEGVSFPFQS